MNFKHDYSFVSANSQTLIDKGLAELSIHSLNFDRYFSEEEKEQNREEAEKLNANCTNSQAWLDRCETTSKMIYNQMLPIAEMLNIHYDMYQYDSEKSSKIPYTGDWNLFFYSNKGWNRKDYFDHMQISFNKKRTAQDNMSLLQNILSLLQTIEAPNINCRIQYSVVYHDQEIAEQAKNVFEQINNKFVQYNGMTGRIKQIDNSYGFFKKGSRKYYYPMENISLLFLNIA